MLDTQVYGEVARKMEHGEIPVSEAYDWTLKHYDSDRLARMVQLIDESGGREARVMFYRVLYRFHLQREEVRNEYLKLLEAGDTSRDRLMVIRAADWIDLGCYDRAFRLLTEGLNDLNNRWLKSALFQMVRIGARSEAHADLCLGAALRLRGLLEDEFRSGRYEDHITKYALCSLFVTRQWIRRMSAKASPFVKRVSQRMEGDIQRVLSLEENWDAC